MKQNFLILSLIISMNASAQLQPVTSGVYHWNELPVKKDGDREGRKILEGTTYLFDYFEMHATTQQKGAIPKPPHTQKDREELIIIREGSMKVKLGNKEAILDAGDVIIIPPLVEQSFENVGDGPLTYYVMLFRSKNMNMVRSDTSGGALLLKDDTLQFKKSAKGGGIKYFDRATAMCENFEMHITKLDQKGPSHNPHQHIATEIILVIDGEVSMTIDGKDYTGGPGDLFIAESNKMHGVGNASDKPCSYFAFKWR